MAHGYATPPTFATQSEFKWKIGDVPLKFKPRFYAGPPESDESEVEAMTRPITKKTPSSSNK